MLRTRLIQAVRDRRRQLGWTQRELAQALGSSRYRVSTLEAGDPTVSLDLVERALEVMATSLRVAVDPETDVLADPELDDASRAEVGREILRRRLAKRIAAEARVDEADVRNVLLNLERSPLERLARMFRRATLLRQSVH